MLDLSSLRLTDVERQEFWSDEGAYLPEVADAQLAKALWGCYTCLRNEGPVELQQFLEVCCAEGMFKMQDGETPGGISEG